MGLISLYYIETCFAAAELLQSLNLTIHENQGIQRVARSSDDDTAKPTKASEVDDVAVDANMFNEPDDYYQKAKAATCVKHTLRSEEVVNLRLVGHNPLWVRFTHSRSCIWEFEANASLGSPSLERWEDRLRLYRRSRGDIGAG